MRNARKIIVVFLGGATLTTMAAAQVPDLLNALDAGGHSLGMGGSLGVTDAGTLSALNNPAGLAYLDKRELGVAYRNLPTSTTRVTNTLKDPRYESFGSSGSSEFSHFGYALPAKDVFKKAPGTIAITYTLGGYIDDIAHGPSSGIGSGNSSFTVNGYQRKLDARADYYTIGWGRTNASQNLAFGVGLTYVQQKISYKESGNAVDSTNTSIPFGTNVSSTGSGVGAVVGLQYVPPSSPNTSLGLSYRSEIKLGNNESTKDIYDKIPARLAAGVSFRKDNVRGSNDYLVFGTEVQYFFSGTSSLVYDRSQQTTLGLGVEYNLVRDSFRLPIRIGYVTVPSGGSGFGSRNEFTYGLGYRPGSSDYSFDLNWGTPEGGGRDFAISATYRFK